MQLALGGVYDLVMAPALTLPSVLARNSMRRDAIFAQGWLDMILFRESREIWRYEILTLRFGLDCDMNTFSGPQQSFIHVDPHAEVEDIQSTVIPSRRLWRHWGVLPVV
jgi:hypothetical protein